MEQSGAAPQAIQLQDSGTHSLKATLPSLTNQDRQLYTEAAAFWPGTVLTFSVWVPEGNDDLYVQTFSQIDFYQWDASGSLASPLVRGGWTTWTYVVPKTFPGGMQRIGVQIGAGTRPFAGGDVYIDAITQQGGVVACSGPEVTRPTSPPDRHSFDFETPAPEWEVVDAPADVSLSISGDHPLNGSGALKVSLNALGAGEKRQLRISGPATACGQTATLNVWTPQGSDGLTFQAYVQFNGWSGWSGVTPAVVTRGAYTQIVVPVPGLDAVPPIGRGGYQALGIELENGTGAPFSGDVYIDDVSW